MDITEVKVFTVQEEKLKAFVSIVFDHCFMVNDVKIIQGRDGMFISMPSRRKKNGDYKDVAHPLNNETRARIQARILAEYEKATGETVTAAVLPVDGAAPRVRRENGEAVAAAATPAAAEADEDSLDEATERFSSDSFWTA